VLKRLSEATGVHLITCTGFYKDPYIPHFADGWNAEQFAQHFIKEAKEGIAETGILPGVIGEVGTSKNEMKPIERELLIGAAMAGAETGLPVTTHTTLGTLGLEQVQFLQLISVRNRRILWKEFWRISLKQKTAPLSGEPEQARSAIF